MTTSTLPHHTALNLCQAAFDLEEENERVSDSVLCPDLRLEVSCGAQSRRQQADRAQQKRRKACKDAHLAWDREKYDHVDSRRVFCAGGLGDVQRHCAYFGARYTMGLGDGSLRVEGLCPVVVYGQTLSQDQSELVIFVRLGAFAQGQLGSPKK